MKKKIIAFLAVLYSHFSLAQGELNNLIKAQQAFEKGNEKEIKVEKTDVFSKLVVQKKPEPDFPEEIRCINIKKVEFENEFFHSHLLSNLKQKAVGRCLGTEGIGKLAEDIQDYLINYGYVTSRVEIPSQDLSSGNLIFRLTPGKIENVVLENYEIREWVLPFKKGDVLNLRDIEQGLELVQRVPDVQARIRIEPGKEINHSNVIISTAHEKSWNVRAWMNNWGEKSTGRTLIGGTGYIYNQAKMNDIFYLSAIKNAQDIRGGYKNVSAYYSLPYGYWDYEIFYSSSESRQDLEIESIRYHYVGNSKYLSLKGSRLIYRDGNKKISTSAELIKRKVNYKFNGVELDLQRRNMTNARVGMNYKQNLNGAAFESTLSYQRFLPGPDSDKTADMQSGDVSDKSHVFNLDASYIKLLKIYGKDVWYDTRVGVQYSPSSLTLQDQFSIGGRWSVRGFENGALLNGNKGFFTQNNLTISTGYKNIDWYIGADFGQIWGELNPSDFYSDKKLAGVATGIKGATGKLGYEISVSRPLLYPEQLVTDKFITNFNLYCRI